ncbi:hypothetical protein AN641_03295 [Candidatus Epulonipiscioides gigas]|nr:hypothetical protein AN641_03295 [Epulopiscium sp. SCG-C07WGA-EpuloA2]
MLALITGATSGIGKEYAYALAREGYDLIVTGRRKELLTNVAKDIIKQTGANVKICIVNFTDDIKTDRFINFIKTCDIDVLVNNAGYGAEEAFSDDEYQNQEDMIKVHILVPVKLMHIIANQMKKKRTGEIINVSSLASFLTLKNSEMYCATKLFLTSFSKSLSQELLSYNIKVQALCPGFVYTDFHKKLGIDNSRRKNYGPVRWMPAEDVVTASRKDINKIICVPGKCNKLLYYLLNIIPSEILIYLTHFFN